MSLRGTFRSLLLRLIVVGSVLVGCGGVPSGAYAAGGLSGAILQTPALLTDGVSRAAPVITASSRPSFEQRLRIGSIGMLRTLRFLWRHLYRFLLIAATSWLNLAGELLCFLALALLAPLIDRQLLATWRQKGFRAARSAALLEIAVYLRLLLDGRTPALGKALLAFAVIYGLSPADLIRDSLVPFGYVDDFVAIVLASGCFISMCPDRLVEENARKATGAWQRVRRRRRVHGDIVDLELERRRS